MATIRNLLLRLSLDPEGVEEGASKVKSSLTKLEGVVSGVTTAVGIAGGAALMGGLVKALDASAATGKLQAQLGLTAKESGRIGQVAGKLYADNYGSSMEDVNVAIKSVIQNMDGMRTASSASLQETSRRALVVADVMGEDVGKVTAAVATMMRSGIAKNSQEAFDTITRGAQLGGDKAQDLLDTFIEYSVQFKNMGLNGPAAMGLINQGLQAGARNADLVADTIKEFSIEAIAGAPRVAAGFKSLGLDAKAMSAQFAAGGPTSAKALDQVLDKLRAIEDPVKRNQVAIELFGTKAEDMGAALFALDPSKAVSGLNGLAGATDRASDAMGATAASKVEAFKRSLETGLVQVLADNVIPLIGKVEGLMKTLNLTPGDLVTGALALTGLAVAYKGVAGAITLVKGVASGISTAVTIGQGAVTAASNLGGAWDTLRLKGMYAMDAAKRFGSTMVTGISTSAQLVTSLSAQAGAYLKTGLMAAGAATKTLVFEAASKVVALGTKLWAAAQWLLNAAMKANPIGIIITIIGALIAIVVTAYQKNETFRKIVQAVWKGIQAAISFAWNNIIKPVFQAIWNFIVNTLGPKFLWFHNTIVVPVFRKVGQFISTAWNSVIKPIFTTLANFITKTVPDAFKNGVAAIGRFWDKVKAIAKAPVTFMVNTIYNNGIRRIWNWVADKVGLGQLPEIRGFATGGRINQGTTGTADDVLIRASRGEYMVNAASTKRNAGLIDYVNRFGRNKDILKESGFAGDPGGLGIPGYQEGGIIGWVKGFISKGKDFFLNGFMKAAKIALNPIVNLARQHMGGTGFGSMLAGAVNKIVQGVLDKFKPLETKLGGGGGGKVVAAARSQIGVPYSWGGGGPGGPSYGIGRGAGTRGFDCSGLTEYAWYQATHRSIGGTTYSQKGILSRISGPRPGAVGQPHPGHTYLATEKGTIIEAPFTGGFVREVPMRSTSWWGWPPWASSTMDQGGSLTPGWNPPIWNGTGRREAVFTADMVKAISGGRGGNTYHLEVKVAPGTSPAETGRQIVGLIREYERTNGTSWRGFK